MAEPSSPARRRAKASSSYNQSVPAVEQACRVLYCLAKGGRSGLPLTEVSSRVGIHKSKAYSLLNTLIQSALVTRDPTSKTYALGPGLLFLSRAVLDHTDARAIAGPFLARLVEETGATALLGAVTGEQVFIVAKEEATTGIGVTIRIGHRYPLTWGAHGKAIVAFLPEEERERWLEGEGLLFSRAPDAAPAPREAVAAELAQVRRDGYAVDLGGMQPGIHAVSAPLLGSGSRPVGCVIVVGTFPGAAAGEVGGRTAAAAREIGTLLGPTMEHVYRKSPEPPHRRRS